MTQGNVDLDYQKNFLKSADAKKFPSFINSRGENQYIWVYTRNGFLTGAYYGSFLGVA
jgi:hypothetical protein